MVSLYQLWAVADRWLAFFSRYNKFKGYPGSLVGPLLALQINTTMLWLVIIIVVGLTGLWGLKNATKRNDVLAVKLFAVTIWILAVTTAGLLLLVLIPQTALVR